MNKESSDVDDKVNDEIFDSRILGNKQRETTSMTMQKCQNFLQLNQQEKQTYYLMENKNPSVLKLD